MMAAIYTRVSSERQKEEQTIGSQIIALKEYAEEHGYRIPPEWIFGDEGYSGSTLFRPGLERVRDLAWEGDIEAVLIHSPDRLSRKYAYQVLLVEELTRQGVEVVFLRSPKAETPEQELLIQFQGMIAEYERAQIAERTRRGKRYRARMGSINVLSGAPYGYRYVKKTESSAAYYEVIGREATVVRQVFQLYSEEGLSINAIARRLNEEGIPTRTGAARWERSTVWGMLRNPAYQGRACFGKTKTVERKKVTRPLRRRGGFTPRSSAHRDCPREDWIEIPVPPIVSCHTFGLAQELLEKNKHYSTRRTIEPTLLQGILICRECGYAVYRTSTRTSKRKLYYYRCLGSDKYRHLEGRVCGNRPIRQDYLDELVWRQVLQLLEEPGLIQAEIRRRIEHIQNAHPRKRREEALVKELIRVRKGMGKLLDAYQEGLLELEELRQRIPELRKREKALSSEISQLQAATLDQQAFLRLADDLDDFLARLRSRAEELSITEQQKILRLVVKEILVDREKITIKHSIPVTGSGTFGGPSTDPEQSGYLLCSRRHFSSLSPPSPCRQRIFQTSISVFPVSLTASVAAFRSSTLLIDILHPP
ncbi:MAG: recombinase family protein [Acidobacteriota bacterium]